MRKNKTAQGILSLFVVIMFLASILAGSVYYENQITGEVTGMEGVSGLQVQSAQSSVITESGIYNENWEKLTNIPIAGTPYIEILPPRDDGIVVRIDHTKDGGTKTLWIDTKKYQQYQTSSVPSLQRTSTYLVSLGGTNVVLGDYANKDEATKAAKEKYGVSNVIEQSATTVTGTKYYAFLSDGRIVTFDSKDPSEASTKGNNIATALGTTLSKTEPQKFEVTDKTGYSVIIDAPSKNVAETIAKTQLGMTPVKTAELAPETTTKTNEYLIKTDKGIYIIQAASQQEAEIKGMALAEVKKETYNSVEKRFTFEEFKDKNPQITDIAELTKTYNEKYGTGITTKEGTQIAPPVEIKGKDDTVIGYYFNHKTYDTNEEATKAYTQLIQQKNAEKALLELKGTLIGLSPTGAQIAKKGNDIYEFDTKSNKFEKITTETFQLEKTSGDLTVVRTFETNTQVLKDTKVKKGALSIIVDESIAKQIEAVQGKGVEITKLDSGDNVIEFKEKGVRYTLSPLSRGTEYTQATGKKTIEQFKTVFFDKNGKQISADIAKQLKEKGEQVKEKQVHTFRQDEIKENGKSLFLTTYSFRIEKGIEVYEGTMRNQQTGKIEGFIYGEDGNGVILNPDGSYKSGDTTLESKAKTALSKYKSRQFFADLERVFTEFRGLGYYATLFISEDSLLNWREKVDETFSKLYLGTEYWGSKICSTYIDGAQEGIAYAETPQGLAQIGAHVEATRTKPITTENGTSYVYKITFNVRNGDYEKDPRAPEEMNINVVLKGGKMQTIKLEPFNLVEKTVFETNVDIFKNDINIKRGSTFGKAGKNAIVKESKTLYNQICIRFDKIPLKWKIKDKELCNIIQESTGEPTIISTATTGNGAKAAEPEINDF